MPVAVLGLVLAGCSSASDESGAAPSAVDGSAAGESTGTAADAPTESPTADVSVPEGAEVTAQGADLDFGDTATVVFEPDQKRETLLDLTVTSARKGRLSDFEGFILDNDYKKKANYFYVDVKVANLGDGNVGGAPVPLWGVNGDNTLLPAVNFTTKFQPCDSTPLPKKFKAGDSLKTCLVYLSPDNGSLESLSFRPDQAFDPIEWHGDIKPAKKDKSAKGKKSKQND